MFTCYHFLMSTRVSFAPGEFYHIYNRGTEKRDIFIDKQDHLRFLMLLYVANGTNSVDLKLQGRTLYEVRDLDRGEQLVDICGYVLMPNHFHLLVSPRVESGVSLFMKKIGTAYTMYFNKKNARVGALFQGKYKAKHVADDVYLQYLLAYIHLNPVKLIESEWKEKGIRDKGRAEDFLLKYPWSSFLDYTRNEREEGVVINREALPSACISPKDFKTTVFQWLQGRTL